jgi:phosphoribosyl 1,2-cyclic phosphodiesterase
MRVRFWGVRGSVAVSGTPYLHTGGNTTCVEVCHEGHRLVLDGGTGLRALGAEMGPGPHHVHLLFSHVHWDHIQGVPFFAPAFHPGSRITVVGLRRDSGSVLDALARQMRPPQFPVALDALPATLDGLDVRNDEPLEIGPFRVSAVDLDHPDGVVSWRIEAGGRSLVFATDVEHRDGLDSRLLRHAEGADLLLHDAQYTQDEYEGRDGPSRRGWGHATWEQAVAASQHASAARTGLIHHDPSRDDAGVVRIETLARQRRAGVFAAREGDVVAL